MWKNPAEEMPVEKVVVIGKAVFTGGKFDGVSLPLPVYARLHDHTGRKLSNPMWILKTPASLFEDCKGFEIIKWMEYQP